MGIGPFWRADKYSVELSNAQTNTALVTPTGTNRIRIIRLSVSFSGGVAAGSVFFGTEGSGTRVLYGNYADKGGEVLEPPETVAVCGDAGEALKFTGGAASVTTRIAVLYVEETDWN